MDYLKLDQTAADPYAQPTWAQDVESATPFDTKERAGAASVRVANAGIIFDDEQEYWYVVKV